jgi:peroxiredoxin
MGFKTVNVINLMEEQMSKINIGDPARDFSLPATDGATCSLADFQGKKALAVVFSCVHCPYVLAWEDRLIELGRQYRDKGLAMALVCSNDPVKYPADNFQSMSRHAIEKEFPFPFLHDETQAVARSFGAERTPEVFLFDEERKLVYQGAPDDNHEDPATVRVAYLRDAIEAVLADKPVPAARTSPVGCTIKWK